MRVWGNKPDWDHLVNFPMTFHLEKFDCYFLKLFLFLFPFGDSSYMNIKVLIDVAKLFFSLFCTLHLFLYHYAVTSSSLIIFYAISNL